MKIKKILLPATSLLLTLALTGCGSSGDSSSAPASATGGGEAPAGPIVTMGAMKKGSVIVNGIKFTLAPGAAVTIDDNPNRPEAELLDGMEVKVKGTVNADGLTGVADKVVARAEIKGKITTLDVANKKMVVLGHTIFGDDLTTIPGGFGGLQVGDRVEIHGGADDNGFIRAHRIDEDNLENEAEIKGVVSGLSGSTFNIGGTVVTFTPPVTGLADGVMVEARGTATDATHMTATSVTIEDIADAEFQAEDGKEFEIEGFVSGFTGHPGNFKVHGKEVQTTANTRFEHGGALDLDNNVKVEVEGHNVVNGVLIVEKVKFKRSRIKLQGLVTSVDSSARTIQLLGLTVYINDMTRMDVSLAEIAADTTRGIEVRGFMDKDGNIIAERVKRGEGNNDDFVQGVVTSKDDSSRSLTILGINIDLGGAVFDLTTVTAGTTIVKAKGTFNSSTNTIVVRENEVEIED